MSQSKTPAWVWVGCGCFLCILLIVFAIGGVGVAGFTFFKGVVTENADPESRNQAAMDLMGAETLPEGYRAHVIFRMPLLMDIAILTDNQATEQAVEGSFEQKADTLKNLSLREDDLGSNLILYLKIRGRGDAPLEEIISGQRRGNGATVDLDLELREQTQLGQGLIEPGGRKYEWRAYRGVITTGDGVETPAIYALLRADCEDGPSRDLVWIQRIPLTDTVEMPDTTGIPPAPSDELEDTPGDPEALEEMLSYFDLCS